MSTKLTHEIRREIALGGEAFTVIISPDGVRLSRKRFRSGRRLSWDALWRASRPEDDGATLHSANPVPGGPPAV